MFESKDVPTYHVIITVESRPSIDRSIHVESRTGGGRTTGLGIILIRGL